LFRRQRRILNRNMSVPTGLHKAPKEIYKHEILWWFYNRLCDDWMFRYNLWLVWSVFQNIQDCRSAECNGHVFARFFRAFLETKPARCDCRALYAEWFELPVTNVPTLWVKCRTCNVVPGWTHAQSDRLLCVHIMDVWNTFSVCSSCFCHRLKTSAAEYFMFAWLFFSFKRSRNKLGL